MVTLKSHVLGQWHEARSDFATLVDPCTEAEIARVSSAGVDFGAALEFARRRGGPALAELDFASRGRMLLELARVLREDRDELIALSLLNTGATRRDAKFDIDGALHALTHYGELGLSIGERRWLVDGEGIQLARSARFWGQHLWIPLRGVAVHINAFNFPAWGFGEKAACALLCGMPVITKPATSSALVAERFVRSAIDSRVFPEGALSLIVGGTGDLLNRLGPQDVVAFTGAASTALSIRTTASLAGSGARLNVEADSLNAAVLGPDVVSGGETWAVFLRDVEREITQKSGQKCTAVRRIFVPQAQLATVRAELRDALARSVTGNPQDESVTMGPLATASQLQAAVAGVARLREEAGLVHGSGTRVDGKGAPSGKGFFFAPTLLQCDDPRAASAIHEHEVFGPVATLAAYDGNARFAADLVARGGGTLVTSLYSDDRAFVADFLQAGGAATGRLYVGSEKVAAQLPGSGAALPQLLHGGPGRAGGGQELGGTRGLELYMQRVAISGDRAIIERLAGSNEA